MLFVKMWILGGEKNSCLFVPFLHLAQSAPVHCFVVAVKRVSGCAFLMNQERKRDARRDDLKVLIIIMMLYILNICLFLVLKLHSSY